MNWLKNIALAFLLLLFFTATAFSQKEISLEQYEDSLQNKFIELIAPKVDSTQRIFKNQRIKVVTTTSTASDSLRQVINNQIINIFDEVLEGKGSFSYPFKKLNKVSKLASNDGQVRVISWNIPKDNGEYLYYCYIQHVNDDDYKLYKLKDVSETVDKPEFANMVEDSWYGALYYYIREDVSGKKTYYTLFGWDGNNNFSNKKVIECFYFDGDKLVLGPPVFKMGEATKNRLVFEYSKQAKMMLRYDNQIKMVVFDHLAPIEKKFEGQYMYYGPDMSQDGIQFIDGYWVLKPNLDLRNKKEENTDKSIKKSW